MNAAPPLPRSGETGAAPRRGAGYLRQYRAQPRRLLRSRVLLFVFLALGLMFLHVWERTQANALAMERDRLARDVRALENRIQLSTDLTDQAALREGLSMSLLEARGFESPDPARIVEIDPSLTAAPAAPAASGLRAEVARALRRLAPQKTVGNGAEMPAAIHAGVAP
jgi:hypothetical protein